MQDKTPLRKEIGTIMRGGYSQIRGKGFGIGIVEKDIIEECYKD
jgi:glycine cleavage system aminomethyltransferase T